MTRPSALTIVTWLFIVFGALSAVGIAADLLIRSKVTFDFGVLDLWIGLWLMRREPRGLRWALFVLQIGMILPVLAAIIMFGFGAPRVWSVLGVPLGTASLPACIAVVVGLVALSIWQYWALQRPEVRALFPDAAAPEPAR